MMEDRPVDTASGCDTVTAGGERSDAALLALIILTERRQC